MTRPFYYADTMDFAEHVLVHEQTGRIGLMEFSHLLWRPFVSFFQVILTPLVRPFVESRFQELAACYVLIVFLLSVAGIVYLYKLLRLWPLSERSIQWAATLFAVSSVVLNYSRAGTSYMAGLPMLIAALYYIVRGAEHSRSRDEALGGLLLGLSVLTWVNYVWALPAAALYGPIMHGWSRPSVRSFVRITLVTSIVIVIPFAGIALKPEWYFYSSITEWATIADRGTPARGITRTILGFPKLLLFLGQDGLNAKRYLFRDPHNSMTVARLVTAGLWKVILFYLLLSAAFLEFFRTKQYRTLAFLAAGMLPMLYFSSRFDGAALERHMPLMPYLFLLMAFGFEAFGRVARGLAWTILAIVCFVNLEAMSVWKIGKSEQRVESDIAPVWNRWNERSLIVILNPHDDFAEFRRIHPFNPYNDPTQHLQLYALVLTGTDSAKSWKPLFETAAAQTWEKGGEVWISKKLLASRPSKDWYWIENSDSGVHWQDIEQYFRKFRYTDSAGAFMLAGHP